jgi:hypothetical protein
MTLSTWFMCDAALLLPGERDPGGHHPAVVAGAAFAM